VLTLTDGRLGEGNFITQSLLLLVEDVNDNAPVFRPHPPAVSVREDSPPRALAELEATDLDEGPYGQVGDIKCVKYFKEQFTSFTD
jgi:cadherin 23